MREKILLYLVLLSVVFTSCSLNSRIQKADKRYAMGEYYKAADMYKKIYSRIPSKKKSLKASIAYKMGNSYRLIENNPKAEKAYKNAVKFGCKDTLVYYYYAEVLRSSGKYKDAIEMYKKQADFSGNIGIITSGIESCSRSIEAKKLASRYVVTKDKVLNSKYSDFCPSFASADNDIVYFNSTRVAKGAKKGKSSAITGQRDNVIYSSQTNVQGIWENPVIVEGVNSEYDQGAVSFSSNFQTLYFTLGKLSKDETLGAAIYSAERTGASWSDPVEIKILKDSSITVAHPAFDKDDKWLYFVSDMEGSLGGKDIWRTQRDGEGWSVPENLGPSINTEGEEMFPYFGPDGTLYFSSDGHGSIGGLDIFSAKFINDSLGWEVRNMMEPINSRYDDFGIAIAKDGDWGYFSSNRDDRKGRDHIYKFEVPKYTFTIEGVVKSNNGENLGDAVVKIVGDNGFLAKVNTKKNGSYSFPVSTQAKYLLLATCRGFLNSKQEITIEREEKSKTFNMNFTLTSISKPVKMDNIFYEFGSAKLTSDSYKGLDALVKLLNDNPNITIEIGAHTDYVGSDDANKKLSEERAWSVVSYLLSKGIEKERITSVGYGESEPVVPDKSLVRQYSFLKVGTALTEEFIKTLTPEQQETANQINRRTEFKVLKTTYKMF